MRSRRTLGDVFLVRLNPVHRDLMLSGLEIDFPGADEIMQSYLKHILHVGVPGGRMVGLRPKVSYRVRTAKGKRNDIVKGLRSEARFYFPNICSKCSVRRSGRMVEKRLEPKVDSPYGV